MEKLSQEYTEELVSAKRKLDESLGDNFKQYFQFTRHMFLTFKRHFSKSDRYLQTMRQWFTQQLTKFEFDARVRTFLSPESLAAHNRFLLALFNKCSAIADIEDSSSSSQTSTVTEEAKEIKLEIKRNDSLNIDFSIKFDSNFNDFSGY